MRRSAKGLLIGVLTVFMSMFWMVGCSTLDMPSVPGVNKVEAVPLSTVSASLNDDMLSVQWGAVELATKYVVTYGDKTNIVNAPYTGTTFTGVEYVSGSITITIVAQSPKYYESDPTVYTFTPGEDPGSDQNPQLTTLSTPTGLSVVNGQLKWAEVKNATSYTVSDGTKTVTVNTPAVDLAAQGLTVPTSGSITYRVVAKANGYNDSAAAAYTYKVGEQQPQTQTLPTPTGLAVKNGVLSWTPVTNATIYSVTDGDHTATVTTNSINLVTQGLTVPTSGSITYRVVAKANGYNDSAAGLCTYTPSSTPVQPTTLAIPTGLFIASGQLTWTPVKNATSYTVSDGTKTATVDTNIIDLAAKGLNVPAGGTATYTVVAKASGYNDSPSASITHQFEHFHTYNSSWESNKTHHWNVITCGHSILIEDRKGYGAHDFSNGNTCSVCAYQRSAPTLEQHVDFGEYPQTLKAANVTLGANADSDGYYTGSDGAKYVKVTATPYVWYQGFKTKFTNGEWITTGADYFFKVEPIKWRVLKQDADKAFLFCDSIIDHGAYFDSTDSHEEAGNTVYPSNYKYSSIRTWLNGNFYNNAFSSAQQQNIQTTIVDNSAASTGHSENSYACENTQDKIFLLSNREAYDTEYGFISDGTESDSARMLLVSDYARATGAHTSDSIAWAGCGIWWMRSPMWDSEIVVDTGSMSGMVASSKVTSAQVGIAPALWVDKYAF